MKKDFCVKMFVSEAQFTFLHVPANTPEEALKEAKEIAWCRYLQSNWDFWRNAVPCEPVCVADEFCWTRV